MLTRIFSWSYLIATTAICLALLMAVAGFSWGTAFVGVFAPDRCVNNKCVLKDFKNFSEVQNWQTYRNDAYGFTIAYPASVFVDESASNETQFIEQGNPPSTVFQVMYFSGQDIETAIQNIPSRLIYNFYGAEPTIAGQSDLVINNCQVTRVTLQAPNNADLTDTAYVIHPGGSGAVALGNFFDVPSAEREAVASEILESLRCL